MKLGFEKGPWIRILVILAMVFIVVLITRYIIIRELDLGFSIIIAVIITLLYILAKRIHRCLKIRKE